MNTSGTSIDSCARKKYQRVADSITFRLAKEMVAFFIQQKNWAFAFSPYLGRKAEDIPSSILSTAEAEFRCQQIRVTALRLHYDALAAKAADSRDSIEPG